MTKQKTINRNFKTVLFDFDGDGLLGQAAYNSRDKQNANAFEHMRSLMHARSMRDRKTRSASSDARVDEPRFMLAPREGAAGLALGQDLVIGKVFMPRRTCPVQAKLRLPDA